MLQAHIAIDHGTARYMKEKVMTLIMKACVILHSMIVRDERDLFNLAFDYEEVERTTQSLMFDVMSIHAMQLI